MENFYCRKPGVPFEATVDINAGGATVIYTSPTHCWCEIDEMELTDTGGVINNECILLDNFNLATTGAGATRNLGRPRITAAGGFTQIPNIEGHRFLHILTGQSTTGNMRVTIRGREVV